MAAIEAYYEEEMRRPELITPERRQFYDFIHAIYPDRTEGMSEEVERAAFEAHNRRVLEHAEREPSFNRRFLVWHLGDGWEPLYRALDLPVPDAPFPHENKRTEYHGY
jgi:hypothetical protein